jgi:hypothetical protein
VKAETDAAVAALTAVWTAGQVHKVGAVPDSPATPYAVVSVSAGIPQNYRGGSAATTTARRVAVQYVGRTYDECAFAVQKGDAAFLGKRISPANTPCRREIEPTIQRDPDGGALMYALGTFTYA